jgi:CRISPR system Cascade subunit CasA
MMKMNLTTDPWIPVVWNDGRAGTVSLRDAFERGADIQDLAVRPHERIALMRLLICVAQAALDGPKDRADWQTCRPRIVPAATAYLKKWQHAFELFGDGQRFLQVNNLKPADKTDDDEEGGGNVSKLDLALATGNNTTLFDNSGGTDRSFVAGRLALMLLTYQCFSPGGRIGVAKWNGKPTPGNGSSDHAPCLAGSMLHTLIRGDCLLESINRNLLTKEIIALLGADWGQAVWESFPATPTAVPTKTYLGRLVPVTRAIRLLEDGQGLILANATKYAPYPEWREPSATIKVREKKAVPERFVLGASLDRAPWRELSALAVRRVGRDTNGGPVALQNLSEIEPFDLWVGGLVADKAKLLDTVETVFHVPAGMLTEPGQRIYEDGVQYASDLEYRLRRAISTYHKELGNNLDRAEMLDQRKRIQTKATFQFWTDVERGVPQLLDVVAAPADWPAKDAWAKTVWGTAVWTAANRSLDAACARETPRQLRAFTLARQALFRWPSATPTTDQPEETTA